MSRATTMDLDEIIDNMLDGTSETPTTRDTLAMTPSTPPSDGSEALLPHKSTSPEGCRWGVET